MKSTFLVLSLAMACAVLAHAGDFSDGWRQGFCEGCKQVKGAYSLAPLPPLPPLPPLGENDYQGGFAAGVLAGAEAAEEQ
jgi:hypothetical protein